MVQLLVHIDENLAKEVRQLVKQKDGEKKGAL
jgi:hypothetical protein